MWVVVIACNSSMGQIRSHSFVEPAVLARKPGMRFGWEFRASPPMGIVPQRRQDSTHWAIIGSFCLQAPGQSPPFCYISTPIYDQNFGSYPVTTAWSPSRDIRRIAHLQWALQLRLARKPCSFSPVPSPNQAISHSHHTNTHPILVPSQCRKLISINPIRTSAITPLTSRGCRRPRYPRRRWRCQARHVWVLLSLRRLGLWLILALLGLRVCRVLCV